MATRKTSPTKPKTTKSSDISTGTANIAAKAKALKKANSPVKDVSVDRPSEDFIACGLCHHALRDPRTLNCLHSFCKKCLLTNFSEKSDSSKTDIRCPVCFQVTKSSRSSKSIGESIEHIPPNDFLRSYIEAVNLREPDKACDTCSRQGNRSTASQWCSMCHDALCDSCVGFHNALKTTKQHHIIQLDKLRQQPLEKIISSPLCTKHEGENITKYCENHSEVLCDKCVADTHKECKSVRNVKDAATKAKADISQVNKLLDEETKLAKSIHENRSKAVADLDDEQTAVLRRIREVKQRINENLAKCESHIIEELENIHSKEKSVIKAHTNEAQELRRSTGDLKALAISTERYGTASHQLTNLPATAAQSEHYKTKLASLNGRIKNTKIDFVVDETLGSLMQNINRLGELRIASSSAQLPSSRVLRAPDSDPEDEIDMMGSQRTLKSFKSVKSLRSSTMFANLLQAVDAKTSSDTEFCWFTGITYLPDGRIVLVDRNNCKLKVINNDLKLVSETKLENQPFGISRVSATEIAVTIPRENKIDLFTVGTTLAYKESIQISDRGYGVSFANDRFVVACSCASPPAIKVISRSGEEKQELNPEDNYHPMFFRPWYVKLDTSGSKMYVSDCHRSHVICISGTVMKQYVYKDNSLNSPRGLCTSNDGRVIVCGFGSDNVQVLDKDGFLTSELLTRSDDVMGPQDVALNDSEDKMVVTFDPSSGMSDFVRIYGVKL